LTLLLFPEDEVADRAAWPGWRTGADEYVGSVRPAYVVGAFALLFTRIDDTYEKALDARRSRSPALPMDFRKAAPALLRPLGTPSRSPRPCTLPEAGARPNIVLDFVVPLRRSATGQIERFASESMPLLPGLRDRRYHAA